MFTIIRNREREKSRKQVIMKKNKNFKNVKYDY